MTDNERELDLQLGDALRRIRELEAQVADLRTRLRGYEITYSANVLFGLPNGSLCTGFHVGDDGVGEIN